MTVLVRPQGTLQIGPLAEDVIVTPASVAYTESFPMSVGTTRGWVPGNIGTTVVFGSTLGRNQIGALGVTGGTAAAHRSVSGLEIGRSYTLEAWGWGISGNSLYVAVAGVGVSFPVTAVMATWRHVSYTFTATATTHTLQLISTSTGTHTTTWDDVTLTANAVYTDTPEFPAEEGSARLDAMGVPYATARVVVPILDENLPELIDPRISGGLRAILTGEDQEAGTSRVFDLSVRSRRVVHENKSVELELASDEAILQAYAPITDDTGARAYEASLRGVVNYVLGKIGASLEAGATDADVTAAWEVTNLLGNPSFETNATGWSSTSLASVTRSTSIAAVFGSGYCNQTSSASGAAFMQRDERINVTPSTEYTLSGYMRPNTSGLTGRLIIRWISAEGTTIRESTVVSSTLSTSAWTRVSVTATAPKNATTARILAGATFTASGQVNRVDALMFNEGELTTYVDGSLAADTYYSYAWDDGADSTSHRTPFVERDPDMFVWPTSVTAWEFLRPIVAAGELRLFCDEARVWRLVDPALYTTPGVLTLSPDFTAEGSDTITVDDPDLYCTGVVVRYTWTSTKGVEKSRTDTAGTAGLVHVVDLNRPWPGDGVAAWMLARRTGQGRVQEVTAVVDWAATPAMQVSTSLPGTLPQVGELEAVEWGLTEGFMNVTARALTDIIPGSIDAETGTIDTATGTIDTPLDP